MRLGVILPQTEIGDDPIVLRDYAQTAEQFRYLVTPQRTLLINSTHVVELTEIAD